MNFQLIRRVFALGLFSALAVVGCSSDSDDSNGLSGSDALSDVGTELGLPSYLALANTTANLSESIAEYCADPTETNGAAARSLYVDARLSLSAADAIWIGPAEELRSRSKIDPPVEPADIEEAIDSIDQADLSAEYVSESVGATKRGLGTVEYLLFGEDGNTIAPAGERCSYLQAVAASVALETGYVLDEWENGDDIRLPYVERIGLADNAEMITSDLLNSQVALLRNVIDMQLAPALGLVGEEGTSDVDAIVEGGAGLGRDDLLTQVQSIRDYLVGSTGDQYFASTLGEELSEDLLSDVQGVVDAGEPIDGSLKEAAKNNPDQVQNLYDSLVELEATLSTQVVDKLGVTIGFSDADGDGAN